MKRSMPSAIAMLARLPTADRNRPSQGARRRGGGRTTTPSAAAIASIGSSVTRMPALSGAAGASARRMTMSGRSRRKARGVWLT
jgi:hypothetical protein